MTAKALKIRFVGGPWHNRFALVRGSRPVTVAAEEHEPVAIEWGGYSNLEKPTFRIEEYFFHQYKTQFGTTYCQYVHSSISPCTPSVHSEQFATGFEINLRWLVDAVIKKPQT